jgi:hypothetical protein
MKLNFLFKLLFLVQITCSFNCLSQNNNWTEKQWVEFRKWETNIYDWSVGSLAEAYPDSSEAWVENTLLKAELKEQLIVNGKLFRKIDFKDGMPDITDKGHIAFYYPNGKLMFSYQINLIDNEYKILGGLITLTMNDIDHLIDSSKTYSPNGKLESLIVKSYELKTMKLTSTEGYSYWNNGVLSYKMLQSKPYKKWVKNEYYSEQLKSFIKSHDSIEEGNWKVTKSHYFDTLGNEISKNANAKLWKKLN